MNPNKKTEKDMARIREAHDYVKPNRMDDTEPNDRCPAVCSEVFECEGQVGHVGPHYSRFFWET